MRRTTVLKTVPVERTLQIERNKEVSIPTKKQKQKKSLKGKKKEKERRQTETVRIHSKKQ